MAQNSSIEWTDHTFNPVRGCTKISPGCANCYAARDAKRFPRIRGIWGDSGTRIVAVPSAWKEPLKWDRQAARTGTRPRVFCASLADVFEDWKGQLHFPCDIAPGGQTIARWDGTQLVRELDPEADARGLQPATMDHLRLELFDLIRRTPHLDWLLLTKRPGNWRKAVEAALRIHLKCPSSCSSLYRFLRGWLDGDAPANIWIGTTVEDQQRADERIPRLLLIPATVRFLSCEPLLGPVDLVHMTTDPPNSGFALTDGFGRFDGEDPAIHWVICGGESGPGARPMHPEWARSLRDQCQAAGVAFFFKQWGEWHPDCLCPGKGHPDRTIARPSPGTRGVMFQCGKHAGRLLDHREWNELPAP